MFEVKLCFLAIPIYLAGGSRAIAKNLNTRMFGSLYLQNSMRVSDLSSLFFGFLGAY